MIRKTIPVIRQVARMTPRTIKSILRDKFLIEVKFLSFSLTGEILFFMMVALK